MKKRFSWCNYHINGTTENLHDIFKCHFAAGLYNNRASNCQLVNDAREWRRKGVGEREKERSE